MQLLMETFSVVGLAWFSSHTPVEQPHLLPKLTSKENLCVFSPLFSAGSKNPEVQHYGDSLL